MPERVTKEERIVSLAIEKARRAKELLQQESVHERLPLDDEIEVEKVKRPKVTNVKPKNQTQKKEGYGLAGETTEHAIKKSITDEDRKSLAYRFGQADKIIELIHDIIKDKSSIDDLTDKEFKEIKRSRYNSDALFTTTKEPYAKNGGIVNSYQKGYSVQQYWPYRIGAD